MFEWTLDQSFLIQRTEVPGAPDSLALIGLADEGDGFVQHYFDSRGVARVYAMTLSDGVWTLTRTAADFTPLKFSQRYIGEFSPDRRTITGGWEISHDGQTWERDFQLVYRRR